MINLSRYVLSVIYKFRNCSIDIDSDFWEDLADIDLEEVIDNV